MIHFPHTKLQLSLVSWSHFSSPAPCPFNIEFSAPISFFPSLTPLSIWQKCRFAFSLFDLWAHQAQVLAGKILSCGWCAEPPRNCCSGTWLMVHGCFINRKDHTARGKLKFQFCCSVSVWKMPGCCLIWFLTNFLAGINSCLQWAQQQHWLIKGSGGDLRAAPARPCPCSWAHTAHRAPALCLCLRELQGKSKMQNLGLLRLWNPFQCETIKTVWVSFFIQKRIIQQMKGNYSIETEPWWQPSRTQV